MTNIRQLEEVQKQSRLIKLSREHGQMYSSNMIDTTINRNHKNTQVNTGT